MLSAHAPRRYTTTRPAGSFRAAMARAILAAFCLFSVAAGAVGIAGMTGHLADPNGWHGVIGAEDAHAPTVTPTYPEQLAADHHCWTAAHPAPTGTIPGHAVVTLPGDVVAKVYPSRVGFNVWLGHDGKAGTGDERKGTVTAFCP